MGLVYEEYDIFLIFKLFYYLFNPVFKHTPEYCACHNGVHLKIYNLLIPESFGNLMRLQFYLSGKPFHHGCFPNAWLAGYHNRIAPLNMAEDLHYLVYLSISSNNHRKLVIIGKPVKVNSKVLKIRRQIILFFQFFAQLFPVSYLCRYPPHNIIRIKAEASEYLCRKAVAFLKYSYKEVCGIYLIPSPSLSLFPCKFKDSLCCRRNLKADAYILAGYIKVVA